MGFLDNVKDALKDAVTSRASKDQAAREKAAQGEAATRDDVVVDRPAAAPASPTIPIDTGSVTDTDSADDGPTHEPASEQREDAREAKFETYTVKVGDSLSEIGARFGVSHQEIAKLNSIENPDLIFPGQVFRIPRS